mgnify:CR=1 FL=1
MDPRADPSCLLPPLRERERDLLARIEELVNLDSGSWSADGVNRVADRCEARFRQGGWKVERHPHRPGPDWTRPPLGDVVVGRRTGGLPVERGGRRLLLRRARPLTARAGHRTLLVDADASEPGFRCGTSGRLARTERERRTRGERGRVVIGMAAFIGVCQDHVRAEFGEEGGEVLTETWSYQILP